MATSATPTPPTPPTPPAPWRVVLRDIFKAPGERQRLANVLGLSVMTLNRWANGNTVPQRPHLIRLVQVIPQQYREELLAALGEMYPDVEVLITDDAPEFIPTEFCADVLKQRTLLPERMRFGRLSEMILDQMLRQFDPNQFGMSVTFVQCMPPSARQNGEICSLREITGKGTVPWTTDLGQLTLFLGAESLAGYVVERRSGTSIDDLRKETLRPAYQVGHEISAAASPIMLGGWIAGCLSVSSTQVGHFSQQRLQLLNAFSDLSTVIFDRKDFYDPDCIRLRLMPRPDVQQPIIAEFRQRVFDARDHRNLSSQEIEQRVWGEIEEEFLNRPPQDYIKKNE